jgi:hypothetical protein
MRMDTAGLMQAKLCCMVGESTPEPQDGGGVDFDSKMLNKVEGKAKQW